MNKDRILELADIIEAGDKTLGFNMSTYGTEGYIDLSHHNCGTVACIAGWAVARYGKSGRATKIEPKRAVICNLYNETFQYGRALLDLPFNTANELFNPQIVRDWARLTPIVAARCLRDLAETGQVRWLKALSDSN